MPWISLAFFLANTWMWLETYVRKKFEKSQLHPVSTQLENIAAWTNQNFCLVLDKKKPLFWDHSFHWFFFHKKEYHNWHHKKKMEQSSCKRYPFFWISHSITRYRCMQKENWLMEKNVLKSYYYWCEPAKLKSKRKI